MKTQGKQPLHGKFDDHNLLKNSVHASNSSLLGTLFCFCCACLLYDFPINFKYNFPCRKVLTVLWHLIELTLGTELFPQWV